MADHETFQEAARRILGATYKECVDDPSAFPAGHILNEGITAIESVDCSMMLCGAVNVRCRDGRFRPAMEIYTMIELDRLKADLSNGRPMCERCMEAAGL